MITKEELAKLSRDEVMALYYKKRNTCKTCAQYVEMLSNDQEFIMIKERYSELSIEERRKNKTILYGRVRLEIEANGTDT